MPLTEKEVEELAMEVGEVDWADPFYVNWLKQNLAVEQDNERRLRAAWRFHKIMRNDERMETALQELRRTRQSIETLDALLKNGNE